MDTVGNKEHLRAIPTVQEIKIWTRTMAVSLERNKLYMRENVKLQNKFHHQMIKSAISDKQDISSQ